MARPLRIQVAGLTYHVTARGTARMEIYRDDGDRHEFLALLERVVELHHVDCHAYCLMPNHYHLVLTTRDANLSRAIQHLNSTYGQWWNHRHRRTGHVFQGRFAAQIIQDDTYLLTACRYVVLNPVRAGLVQAAGQYPWSSYLATAGLTAVPPVLRLETLWRHFGAGDLAVLVRRYQRFVGRPPSDAGEWSAAMILGDPEFVERFQRWRESAGPEIPRHRMPAPPSLAAIFAGAATRGARESAAARARGLGYSIVGIARHLELHPSTVSKMIGKLVRGQT